MSVLEKIRNKTGLLIGIIGLALILFVLQSALDSGSTLFGTNEQAVGKIAGSTVSYQDFFKKVDDMEKRYQKSGQPVDDQMKQMIVDQTWNQLINEKVVKEQYNHLGLTVGEEELVDMMLEHPHAFVIQNLTDRQSGKVYPQFAKNDGSLDNLKLKSFVKQMNAEQETFWKELEDQVKEVRVNEKYNNLIKKGLYTTTSQAKFEYEAQNHAMNVKFIVKRYSAVPDSSIKVSDEDLQKYYNEHLYQYKNDVTTRKIEYLVWDASASEEDILAIKKRMEKEAEDFRKTQSATEDSLFISENNEDNALDIKSLTKSQISPQLDSSIFTAATGTVFGPYQENNMFKVSKLLGQSDVPDSSKVRHILLAYAGSGASQEVKRTKEQARKMADSLLTVLKKDNKQFAEMVKNFSDDGGKKMPPNKKEGDDWTGKDGNYGWLNDNSGFVESFKKFALNGKKGELGVVESNYGYHIMEVLDISKGRKTKYTLGTIAHKIVPSEETHKKFYALAVEFAGKNSTKELFDKAVEAQKLNKRIADNIQESETQIAGLEKPKELVRWIYTAKLGEVSSTPFTFGDRYVVAVLAEIKEKGTAPLEQFKEEITMKVKTEKKAEQFMNDINAKSAGAKTIEELAGKLTLGVERSDNLLFSSYSLTGVGREDAVCGAASVAKVNQLSKPIKGQSGVFVILVENSKDNPAKDYKETQKNTTISLTSRVDYEVFDALKQLANIEDHKAKYF